MNSDFNELANAELHLYDGLQDDLCIGENFLIPGPAGPLEALLSSPAGDGPVKGISVICHPHPLHGGTLANKVVHIVANSFNDLGRLSLRFNFRGVGRSKGRYDRGVGEVQDLIAVVGWLRERYPDLPLWLAGFSFGSYVTLKAQAQLDATRILLVAPPISIFDFTQLSPPTVPWMVIQGAKDDVVSPEKVSLWVGRQKNAAQYVWFADADHFFHGKLSKIRAAIDEHWAEP
ncbi:MAG: alpha/beta hydrolase [Thiohalomonadales bacterium]